MFVYVYMQCVCVRMCVSLYVEASSPAGDLHHSPP